MKLSKVFSIIAVVLMLSVACGNLVYATTTTLDPGTITPNYGTHSDEIKNFGGRIVGAVQLVATVVAIVILAVIGIKYMMGSASEKAEYKKTMIPYIVGALLVFGAAWVSGIIYDVVMDVAGTSTVTK